MKPNRKIVAGPVRLLSAAAFAMALAACSQANPVNYTAIDEIPPGPGLITGEAGEFSIYR